MPSKTKLTLIDELTTTIEWFLSVVYDNLHDGVDCPRNTPDACPICRAARLVTRVRNEGTRHSVMHMRAALERDYRKYADRKIIRDLPQLKEE